MKIRNLSKVALAIAISSAVVLEGCKKYDDDISRLEQSINQNTSDIAGLKKDLAALAANNVVEKIETTNGGFIIHLKDSKGNVTTYTITNGKDGKDGTNGKDGAPGIMWQINKTTNMWESSDDAGKTWKSTGIVAKGKDGKDGVNGNDGAPGKDGVDGINGKDGSVVTIKKVGNKYTWHIDDRDTEIQAYPGDISISLASDGSGYNLKFTDSEGNETDSIFLSKEAVAVSNLTLVLSFTNANTPVVFFPRIVDNDVPGSTDYRKTLLQGYAEIKYNLNPFGVAVANYNAEGLLSQETEKVSFRSGGHSSINSNFVNAGVVKNFGDIVVKYRPNKAENTGTKSLFPKHSTADGSNDLFIALQVKNLHSSVAESQRFVASPFNIAKEEIIEKDEVTIEKAVSTNSKVDLISGYNTSAFNGSSFVAVPSPSVNTNILPAEAEANNAHFTLNIYENADKVIPGKNVPDNNTNYTGAIQLEKELRGFFARTQVGNKIVSMDNNGLEGYDLRFDFAPNVVHTTSQGSLQENWLNLNKQTGAITVKESTTGNYNTAAAGNYAIVKVDLYASEASNAELITTRYIKVGFKQNSQTALAIASTAKITLTNASNQIAELFFTEPNTVLDQAYNITSGSSSLFHNTYEWKHLSSQKKDGSSSTTVNNNWFNFQDMDNTNQTISRKVIVDQTKVNPGVYVLKGLYEPRANNTNLPVVNVTIELTVGLDGTVSYVQKGSYWVGTGANAYVRAFGSQDGNTNWYLGGDMKEYIQINNQLAGSNAPNVTHKYTLVSNNYQAVAGFGSTQLPSTPTSPNLGNGLQDPTIGDEFHLKNGGNNLVTGNGTTTSAYYYVAGWNANAAANKIVVRVDYFLNGNPAPFKSENINVQFVNPVKNIVLNENGTSITDKSSGNNGNNPIRVSIGSNVKVENYLGTTIWSANSHNNELITRYGMTNNFVNTGAFGLNNYTGLATSSVSIVKAYYEGTTADIKNALPNNTELKIENPALLNGNTANLYWKNDGANTITKDIIVEVEVKLTNRYNNGTTNPEEIKGIVKFTIKKNPNSN